MNELRGLHAETVEKVNQLEAQIQQMSGRFEVVEHRARNVEEVNTIKNELIRMKRNLPPPAIVPAKALEVDERTYANPESPLGKAMDEGFLALRESRFEAADQAFATAYDLTEVQSLARAHVLFWIGVTKEARGDFKRAVEAYLAGVNEAPRASIVPVSLLRQSNVFTRIGDNEAASAVLKKLVNEYPKTEEGLKAKERLAELQKSPKAKKK